MTNTEKPTTKTEAKKQQPAKTSKKGNTKNLEKQPKENTENKKEKELEKQQVEEKTQEKQKTSEETKKQVIKDIEKTKGVSEETAKKEEEIAEKTAEESSATESEKPDKETKGESKDKKTEEKQDKETKKPVKKKKGYAIVNSRDAPISSKQSFAICKFIKNKTIDTAIENLELVVVGKKPVPMKGELPHQKGIMSGKFPKKASEHFIKILSGLKANAENNGLENPVISEAVANFASRPLGRFGKHEKKRTNIKLKAIEKAELNKMKTNKKKWKKK